MLGNSKKTQIGDIAIYPSQIKNLSVLEINLPNGDYMIFNGIPTREAIDKARQPQYNGYKLSLFGGQHIIGKDIAVKR